MWLCIALKAAHDKLTENLGRSPVEGTPWIGFIESITPVEIELVGVSPSMLHLMATGKKALNRHTHSANLYAVARVVTSAKKNSDAWRSIFQYKDIMKIYKFINMYIKLKFKFKI